MKTPRTRGRNTSTLLRVTLVGALLLSFLLIGGPTSYANTPTPDSDGFALMTLPPEAMTMSANFVAAKATAGDPKLESSLSLLATAAVKSQSEALSLAESEQFRTHGDRVQILVTTTPDRAADAAAAIRSAGGEVTGRANGDAWLQAWAPVDALGVIASDASIDHVGRPAEAITMAVTEGAAVINAPAWHASGQTGAGVKVAVIDGGFIGYTGLLGTDLPASVTVRNFVDYEDPNNVASATEHGTACAEIVHDIAPDAAIYLVKVNTSVDLDEAVTWVKAQGVNIITTSLGWYNQTPGDGTGVFADIVQSARNAGIFWTTAAGNDRQAHWGGTFSGDSNGYHRFNGTQNIDYFGPGDGQAYLIPSGYLIRVFLRWDDWSAVNQDYDVYIVRWNGSSWVLVASGEDSQTGAAGQTPTEYAAVYSSGSTTAYGFVVARWSASRNVNFEMFAPKVARLDEIVTSRSLANLADACLAR